MPTAPTNFTCRTCGAEVSPNAKGCSKCGTEIHAWSQHEVYDGLDLPGEDYDYDDFVRREFGEDEKKNAMPETTIQWVYWVVAVILLVALGFLFFRI